MTLGHNELTHWGRVTHICVSKLTIIGSDNGLSPGRRQAVIWTNAGILLIWPLGTNFSEILNEIHTFSLKKIHFKMSSGKWRPFCLGLNVLICPPQVSVTHPVPALPGVSVVTHGVIIVTLQGLTHYPSTNKEASLSQHLQLVFLKENIWILNHISVAICSLIKNYVWIVG